MPGYGLLPIKQSDPADVDASEDLIAPPGEHHAILREGFWNLEAGGHRGLDYFLFYYGTHQPRLKNFNLPAGPFRVDVIDTWNMTINTFAERAEGPISVALPARMYMAIRIQRVQ